MIRRLTVSTDGSVIGVEACELTPLELKAVLEILLEQLHRGEFPYPSNKLPQLVVAEPDNEKPQEEADENE